LYPFLAPARKSLNAVIGWQPDILAVPIRYPVESEDQLNPPFNA
jgi:hypothetical protein